LFIVIAILFCRHLVFAPSAFNSYGGALFPGFSDMAGFMKMRPHNFDKYVKDLQDYITDLIVAFKQAKDHFSDPHVFPN